MEEKEKKPRGNANDMNMYIATINNENRELKSRLDDAVQMIESLQTQNLFSYINFSMKVMEHPEMYSEKFVNMMSEDIETLMSKLHNVIVNSAIRPKDGTGSDTEEAE